MPIICRIAILLLIALPACKAQHSRECQDVLDKKISVEDISLLNENLYQLSKCGLDSFDVINFSKPAMLAIFLVPRISDNNLPSYGDYLTWIDSMKAMPEYVALKQKVALVKAIMDKPATKDTWDTDTKPLADLGYTEEELNEAKELMMSNNYERLTYRELFYQYTSIKKATRENDEEKSLHAQVERHTALKASWAAYADTSKMIVTDMELAAFNDLDEAMKCSKKMGRPVLIYFNGWACVNARQMEKKVLRSADVSKAINDGFVFVSLLCDDRTSLAAGDMQYSKTLNRKMTTVGDKNAVLQMERFDANSQPFFILLDKNGKRIGHIGYTPDVKEFMAFLKAGMK